MTLTRKGWNSLKPITAPEQMPAPIHWNPMSDDWKRWIDSHQVYNGESRFSKEMLDAMKALHDKILSFGGDEVCMTAYDEDTVKHSVGGSSSMAAAICARVSPVNVTRIPLIFGMQTVVTALLRPGMLFLRTGFGVVIPGSYSPGAAQCVSGKRPLSVWRISVS